MMPALQSAKENDVCTAPKRRYMAAFRLVRWIDLPPGSPDFFAIVLCLLVSFLRMRPCAAQVCFGVALVLGKGCLR